MNKIKLGLVSVKALPNSCGFLFSNASRSSSILKNNMDMTARHVYIGGGERREGFVIQDKDIESEENLRELYERWMQFHKRFRTGEEKETRFKLFAETAKFVHNYNKQGLPTILGANKLADLTSEEKSRMRATVWG